MSDRPLALVTGGSSGIGLEIAKQLAERGHDVALSGSSDRTEDAAATIRGLGVEAYPHRADAGTYDGVQGFWEFADALGRPVEVAVLNVGIGLGGRFLETDLDDELRLIAINVTGTVHMAKRVARHMAGQGRGRILITSSISATTPTPFETVYGPSKAFGFSFAESLREELWDHGVVVTALLPGPTDSDFHEHAGMGDTKIGRNEKNDKTLVARQGVDALLGGDDHVVGGDEATKQEAVDNRTTSEPEKARRQGEQARPR